MPLFGLQYLTYNSPCVLAVWQNARMYRIFICFLLFPISWLNLSVEYLLIDDRCYFTIYSIIYLIILWFIHLLIFLYYFCINSRFIYLFIYLFIYFLCIFIKLFASFDNFTHISFYCIINFPTFISSYFNFFLFISSLFFIYSLMYLFIYLFIY